MAAWQLFLSLPSQSLIIKSKSLTGMFSKYIMVLLWFLHMYLFASRSHPTVQPPTKAPFFQLHRPAWCLLFFFSFSKWLYKSDLKFCWHVCNTMRSESVITGTINPGYYRAIQTLCLSVFVASLSISVIFSGLPSSLLSPYIFPPPSVQR